MELVDRRVELPTRASSLYIHNITDVHRDAAGCDVRRFLADVEQIRRLNAEGPDLHLWIGGGDWNNGIAAKDKRFDATSVRWEFQRYLSNNLHKKVAERIVKEVAPIAPYCIGYGRGNHEDTVIQYADFDPADYVAERLDVPYLGYNAGIRLRIGTPGSSAVDTLLLYWHHGFGGGRSKAGKINMLLKLAEVLAGMDVYLTGHVHEAIGLPQAEMTLSRKGALRQKAHKVLYINGGTYQRAYKPEDLTPQTSGHYDAERCVTVDYAEKKAYPPSLIGHYAFRYTPDSRNRGNFAIQEVSYV